MVPFENTENLILLVLILAVSILVGVVLWQRKQMRSAGSEVKEPAVIEDSVRGDTASNALFATLSHELRTPLNGLLGIAQILNEEDPNEDVVAIEGCARHMLAVLGTLVNLSKIQTEWDDLPEYREWVNLYELMRQVQKDMAFRAGLRGLKIELQHQDKTTRLRADEDHLKAIIENALLGSIECVSLTEIPNRKQTLQLSWESSGQDVKIVIVNPLEKLSATRRQEVQDAFHLTTGENHARIKMEYLYWAVSTALLERYHGAMYAQPENGGGVNTCLSFEMEQMQASASGELPVGGLSLENGTKAPKAMPELPVRLSLIVAEDDPIARNLMSSVLHHMGQDVRFATNGREVLDLVSQSTDCDLILMDIDMPIMDGVSSTLALRNGEAGELGSHIPIVAVTAFSALSDQGKFKRAGMNYFLPKPVKLKNLREVLLDVIRKERRVAEV